MKKAMVLSFLIVKVVLLSVLPCFAEEFKGEVIKMTDSRLEIKVKGDGNRSFQVTNSTRVFVGGGVTHVHHLLPHTKVRVAEQGNRVEAIFLEGAPK